MKCYVTPVSNPATATLVAEHLKQQFGSYQNCCGVLAPPKGAVLEVLEELQTCHPIEGLRTEPTSDGNVLPKGKYWVLGNICSCRNGSECWLMMEKVPGNATARTFFCVGNPGKKPRMACFGFFATLFQRPIAAAMMDWRGVVNPNGRTEDP